MQNFLISIVVAGIIMGALDFLWLGTAAKKFYQRQIGSLLLEKPNMKAALAFYILYVIGMVLFVILPALNNTSWENALLYGALFGLVGYGTYDLTNLATLKNYPLKLAIVDMIWGVCLTAVVSITSYWIVHTWAN